MDKIFIFDVDGTLTPSRLPMTEKFQKFFKKWIKKNKFYLVTGSDLPKLQEQMCGLETFSDGIFTCCGNQFWRDTKLVYENKFNFSSELKNLLGIFLMQTQYTQHCGNHIEDRGSMINFSIVGRDCNQKQRENYFQWDIKSGERKKIAKYIKEKFTELDAVIGGQISIDIYPKGMDKSQVFNVIKQDRLVKADEYIFIGDGIKNGGNDYPLAKLMNTKDNCYTFQTTGWEQTQEILENLVD